MDRDIFDKRLLYCGIDDFYAKRVQIKAIFLCKTLKEQYIYKLYVYSRPFISETWKDYIWDFLQSDLGDFEFASLYVDMKIKQKKHQQC